MTAPGEREAEPRYAAEERGLFGWARALYLGICDTAQDMLDEGRREASVAYDEAWVRFEKKTRNRRRKR